MAQGKEGLGQALILGAGRPEAKAGEGADRVDREQHVKPFIPAQSPALGIAGGGGGAVQGLIGTALGLQELRPMQKSRQRRHRRDGAANS